VNSLRERGIQRVYGRSLSRCRKDELDEYFRGIVGSQFGSRSYSINEIEQYLRCPLSYYFRYVARVRGERGPFATVALSLRQAIYYWHKSALETGKRSTAGDVIELFRSLLKVQKGAETCSTLADHAEEALGSYVSEEWPEPAIRGLEKRFEIYFANVDYSFSGTVPVILEDSTPVEIKVRVNGKNERDAARDFRLTAYALFMAADGSGAGVEAMHLWEKPAGPVSESQVRLDVLVVGRKPRAQKTESCRTSGDFNHLLRVSAMAVDGISKRAFPPAHPANWSCSPRWCGYYTACRGTR